MKEIPRIFKTEMVRAILENRKTQTRRLNGLKEINKEPDNWIFNGIDKTSKIAIFEYKKNSNNFKMAIKIPAFIGDILWVRETWANYLYPNSPESPDSEHIFYKADGINEVEIPIFEDWGVYNKKEIIKWKPSIYLHREYARIFLKLKNIRFERVQDISGADAFSEGIDTEGIIMPQSLNEQWNIGRGIFKNLWDSINEKRGYGWDKNLWVRVEEFERIEK